MSSNSINGMFVQSYLVFTNVLKKKKKYKWYKSLMDTLILFIF